MNETPRNKIKTRICIIPLMALACLVMPELSAQELATVSQVDLNRFVGKWYEIAALPQTLHKNCYCTSSEYTLTSEGHLLIENYCNKDSVNGRQSYYKAKGTVQDNSGNAKLEVSYVWPFKDTFWILALAPDYSYAVLGNPNRNFLWILSRQPTLDHVVFKEIIYSMDAKGFDTSKMLVTVQ